MGRPITVLLPTDRLTEEPEIIARLKRGERVDHYETVRRKKDGALLDISLTISPVRNEKGKSSALRKIARDITERRRAEAEIRRINQDLEQFAYSASHDLQEPLRSVKIYSELLSRRYAGQFDGEAREFLSYVQSGATRMEALVRDLLIYSQLGSREETSEITDANVILASVLESLSGSIIENNACITSGQLPSGDCDPWRSTPAGASKPDRQRHQIPQPGTIPGDSYWGGISKWSVGILRR